MAVLSDENRDAVTTDLENDRSRVWDVFNDLSKQDLRAAVNAIDQYFHDNQVAMNNTLPAEAKANLTNEQKALLTIFVIRKRYLVDYNG